MRKYILIFSAILMGCNAKLPKVIYQDKVITHYDTITYVTTNTDTIPCDDFKREIVTETDTVYVEVVKNKLSIKTVMKRDTIIRTQVVTIPRKIVTKIDNSITAKKGSIVGNDNTMTTKKNNPWWIFLAGMLTMFILQNVVWKAIKTYTHI